MDNSERIRRLKKHDETALNELIHQYTGLVSGTVFQLSGGNLSASDIEEITADTFITLWYNTDKLQPQSLTGYMLCIAKNKARDKLRKVTGKATVSIDDLEIEEDFLLSDTVEKKALSAALKDALAELSEEDREIIIRHYYFYQSSTVIGEQMNLHPGTVKTRLMRTREKLKKLLTERGFSL